MNDELRAMTNSDLNRESAVMMSSTTHLQKYSCSGSPLMFVNGSTAMGAEGRRALGRERWLRASGPHRLVNVFDLLLAQVRVGQRQSLADIPVSRA